MCVPGSLVRQNFLFFQTIYEEQMMPSGSTVPFVGFKDALCFVAGRNCAESTSLSNNSLVANVFAFTLCQRRSGEPVFAFWGATFCRTKVFDKPCFFVIFSLNCEKCQHGIQDQCHGVPAVETCNVLRECYTRQDGRVKF